MEWSQERDKIAPAFLRAQMNLKHATKDSVNPHFKSKYADLTSVYEACASALHEAGISIVQGARSEIDTYGVETLLLHTSGQYVREVLMLKPDRPGPQAAGSCISYARRYSLASMAGVQQDDDDANHATNAPKVQYSAPKPLTGEQAVARAHEIIQSRKEDGPGTYHPVRQAPTAQSLTGPAGEYIVRFGKKYIGKSLNQISDDELRSYMDYISSQAIKSGKPVEGAVAEFMSAANVYLGNTPPVPSEEELPIPF